MSFEEKDSDYKVGSNGIQASSGPAYGPDALGPRSDVEKNGGMEGYHDASMIPHFVDVLDAHNIAKSSDGHVTRTLKERHLSMIALGGAIGTGSSANRQ